MSEIELQNVTKRFEDVVAVDGIDVTARDGEFLVLVGPSGCGKSTTLRLISGLETVTSGQIKISDRDVTDVAPEDRNVAMVFQNYALYPHMSARRNITFGMKSAGDFSDEEIDERVADAAEKLDITDLLDRKPSELSGGEQQRVAIGRAIVRDPEVFLMDEPLSNLDAKLRVQMRAELSELHSTLGTTTIYVTHDQVEAMTLGDRVAVMEGGDIQQVDQPQTLYDRPETQFVAEFIGDPAMNVFDVEILESDRYHASWGGGQIELPPTDELEHLAGEGATLGVRPEDITITDSEQDAQFDISVTVSEPLGDSKLLTGTVDGTECKIEVEPRTDISAGDRLGCMCDPERLHLFDNDTGQAIYHSVDSTERTENKAYTKQRDA